MFIDNSQAKLSPALTRLIHKYEPNTDDLTVYLFHANKTGKNNSIFHRIASAGDTPYINLCLTGDYQTDKFVFLHEFGHYQDWKAGNYPIEALTPFDPRYLEREVRANIWAISHGATPIISDISVVSPALDALNITGRKRARLLRHYGNKV